MIRAHAAALFAFYQGASLKCYDGEAGLLPDGTREAPTFPYAVVTMSSPSRSTEHQTHERERAEFDVTVSFHSDDPDEARWAAERVDRLAGQKLPVVGRQCLAESAFTALIRPDRDDPRRTVYSGATGFTLVSYPAA